MLLNILLGILFVVAVAMIAVILLQRSEGGGLVSGGSGQLISARGAGNILTKATQILGTIFFVLSLAITILMGRQPGIGSVTDRVEIQSVDPNALRAQQLQQQQQALPQQQQTAPANTLNPFGGAGAEPTIDQAPGAPPPAQ